MRKHPLHPYTAIINKKQKAQSKLSRHMALHWLATTFPEAFDTSKHIRPLKIGIMNDIMNHAEKAELAGISKTKLREALVIFTRRVEYLVCLKAREVRIDLHGHPTTPVSEEDAEKAATKLKKRIEKTMRSARKEIHSTTTYTQTATHKTEPDQTHHQHQPLVAYSGQTETSRSSKHAPVVIKHKTTRQFDPDSVARLKAKLGISRQASTEGKS